jgi:hypothetical protein
MAGGLHAVATWNLGTISAFLNIKSGGRYHYHCAYDGLITVDASHPTLSFLKNSDIQFSFILRVLNTKLKKLNPVALESKRTIPTERPPLVGKVSANFMRIESATDPHGR